MKLNGEEEEEEKKVVVGYALTSKKKKSFLKPNFIALARSVTVSEVFCTLLVPLSITSIHFSPLI
jgi:inositol-1,3,4-trisphosphate 5/6-kinase/inositol-tetrakisphosphate 1-kinase